MLNKIIDAVKKASELLLCEDFDVFYKDGVTNLVTSKDLEVEKSLYESLKKDFPNASFLGEETLKDEIRSDLLFIIDPIDGTCNFSRGMNLSCISVALAVKGEVRYGVVYNPFTDEMFVGEKGKGSYLIKNGNTKRISVSNKGFNEGLLCTAMSLYDKKLAPVCFDIIEELYYECNDVRRLGTCALELCYLACGRCDLYFEIRVFPWDYAAGMLILEESGGFTSMLNKEKPKLDAPTVFIAANNKENFDHINEVISKHIKEKPYKE